MRMDVDQIGPERWMRRELRRDRAVGVLKLLALVGGEAAVFALGWWLSAG